METAAGRGGGIIRARRGFDRGGKRLSSGQSLSSARGTINYQMFQTKLLRQLKIQLEYEFI